MDEVLVRFFSFSSVQIVLCPLFLRILSSTAASLCSGSVGVKPGVMLILFMVGVGVPPRFFMEPLWITCCC